MSRTVIIDGDVLVYKAAEAAVETFELDIQDDSDFLIRTISSGSKSSAAKVIEEYIDWICEQTKSTDVVVALSDADHNFRKDINPTYKHTRKSVKPVLYKWIREWFHKNYKVFERPSLEADDVIGILATSKVIIKDDKVVWSMDKDFKTVPCVFYRESTLGKLTKHIITEFEANKYFMTQVLTGDPVDGYSGCPKVGAKTAEKVFEGLTTIEDMWRAVVGIYEKRGLTEADALLNARMARILRADDYDFKNKEVKLWKI